jgi:hypothetical protein
MSLCTIGACTADAIREGRCATHAQGMSITEFMPGWLLLVTQPWGHRYNQTIRTGPEAGKPTPDASLQLKFYHDGLKHGSPAAWMKTAATHARGREWPSVEDLRRSLRNNEEQPRQLRDDRPRELVPMPPAVKAMVLKVFGEPRRQFGCFIDESVPEAREESHV